jgi:hypothetical protein
VRNRFRFLKPLLFLKCNFVPLYTPALPAPGADAAGQQQQALPAPGAAGAAAAAAAENAAAAAAVADAPDGRGLSLAHTRPRVYPSSQLFNVNTV